MPSQKQTPKSGKFWKSEQSKFGSIKKGPRKTFEKRMKMKEEQAKSSELAKLLIESKIQKKQELRFVKEILKPSFNTSISFQSYN